MKGYIYKIENTINGKVYIGKTNRANPISRWSEHINNKTSFLGSDIDDIGIENFTFGVIDVVDINKVDILALEQEYIRIYDSYRKGYNRTDVNIDKSKIDKDYLDSHINEHNIVELIIMKSTLLDSFLFNNRSHLYNRVTNVESLDIKVSINDGDNTITKYYTTGDIEGLFNIFNYSESVFGISRVLSNFSCKNCAELNVSGTNVIIEIIDGISEYDTQEIDIISIEGIING